MNIIVIGAGKVGYIVAERLSHDESNNVTVIEKDRLAADKVAKSLNINLVNDSGSNPRALREAIERHEPDVIISAVERDEDNLFICMIAKSIKPDIIVLGYDQGFNEEELHQRLSDRGMGHIRVVRADECADDLNATRRIVDRIRKMGDQ